MSTLKIIYGSETGNAQMIAEQLWQTFHSMNLGVECFSMDDYSIQLLSSEKLIIFVISTSGQGEVPTNMRENWSFLLSKDIKENWLSNVKFALLGLGDSSYQKYNYAGKKMYRRLLQLGANPVLDLALADEQHRLGIDEAYEKWVFELLNQKLFNQFICESQIKHQSKFYIDFHFESKTNLNKFRLLEILRNDRFTSLDHFQDTRLITLTQNDLKYNSGDILMILPENLPKSIEMAQCYLKSCQPLMNIPFSICRIDPSQPKAPQYDMLFSFNQATLDKCLKLYFDLQAIPRRSFIFKMAERALDSMERERLFELSSTEGIDDYLDYCIYSKRTIAEFLQDFPETAAILTPNDLFDFFPVIRSRAFSIASSPNAHSGELQILVARVKYNIKKMKTPRFGLCSNFLCSTVVGQKVYAQIRLGTFRQYENMPVILIGPGTGVAPFRSIISDNEFLCKSPETILFFGCRGQFTDYYFRDEWLTYKKAKIINAFSRDQEDKIYVQHRICEYGKEVWELINKGAKIFIAGAAGEMPKQVVSAIKQAIIKFGGISPQGADKYIEIMERKKYIQFETWS